MKLGPLRVMPSCEIDEVLRYGVELHGLSTTLEPFEQWVLTATPLTFGEWLAVDGPTQPPHEYDYVER